MVAFERNLPFTRFYSLQFTRVDRFSISTHTNASKTHCTHVSMCVCLTVLQAFGFCKCYFLITWHYIIADTEQVSAIKVVPATNGEQNEIAEEVAGTEGSGLVVGRFS